MIPIVLVLQKDEHSDDFNVELFQHLIKLTTKSKKSVGKKKVSNQTVQIQIIFSQLKVNETGRWGVRRGNRDLLILDLRQGFALFHYLRLLYPKG